MNNAKINSCKKPVGSIDCNSEPGSPTDMHKDFILSASGDSSVLSSGNQTKKVNHMRSCCTEPVTGTRNFSSRSVQSQRTTRPSQHTHRQHTALSSSDSNTTAPEDSPGPVDDVKLFNLEQEEQETTSLVNRLPKVAKPSVSDSVVNALTKRGRIVVCVRKRPRNKREIAKGDMDILKIPAPDHIVLCEPRQRFDLTEYLEQTSFRFDHCFEEHADTAEVYQHTAAPMVKLIFQGYMATCFAYGQTGSGKTFTMGGPKSGSSRLPVVEGGIYGMVVEDLFALYEKMNYSEEYTVSVNYFEIYCNKVYDLLNQKRQLRVMEDSFGSVQLLGLREYLVKDAKTTLGLLRHGYQLRTNGQTLANEQSSRSHAIFQINIRNRLPEDRKRRQFQQIDENSEPRYYQIASTPCTYPNPHYSGPLYGRFSLVDLAGNERSVDSASTLNRFQHLESGEINKSLLALKECIRAMGNNTTSYLPFRTSKLTQVLRESFVGKRSCTCMIATVSPGLSCCEHSMNTLRYAQRVKHLVPSSFVPKVSYYVSHLTTDTDWFQPRSRAASALSRKGSRAAGDGKHQFCRQLNSAKPAKSQSDKPKTPSLSVDQPPEDRETPSYRTTRSSLKHSVRHTPRPATTPNSTSSLGSSTDSQALSDMPMTDFETVDRLTSSADTREVRDLWHKPCCTRSATSTPKCNTNVSARRHRFLRLQKQKHDVIKKHEELIKTLPKWIAEHRRLLERANREKHNMLSYVTLLTNRLSKDIDQLKTIQDNAMVLRCLQSHSS
ncbi:Kinesin-like protein Klp10A [Clonorchis sinensis]|uniref:Kinesin-like protein n=1 Tax=Clonorchis sinensis TaxID=79923 RepID=A0A8T1N0W4_CLOSI|nr:Kinesin-like protein Klp10A [Clonorchis sinensis]